jgi:hypothetical protein
LLQYFGWKREFSVGAEADFGSLDIATTGKANARETAAAVRFTIRR